MKKLLLLSAIFSLGILLQSPNVNAQDKPAAPEPVLKPGDVAPTFNLKNVDGKMISLDEYKSGAIVVFTCNHCPFSKKYEGRIIELHNKFKDAGFPVIAINSNDSLVAPDDSYSRMQETAANKEYPFPYVLDNTQKVAKSYGATRTPHVFIVQREKGKMMVKYIGAIDDNADDASAATKHYVENAIGELKTGSTVSTPTTRAIGCTIKWNKG